MSARRPTPRNRKDLPSGCAVFLVCILMAVLFAAMFWIGSRIHIPTEAERRPTRTITHDSMTVTYTNKGDQITWYVMTDPDTGIQYVVNSLGGTCPRLDSHGGVMGVTYEEEAYDG